MKARIPVLMDLFKGVAAIVLSILLFFIPDKSSAFLLNTMGFFWLTIGLSILRRGQEDERYPGKHTALIVGVVAVLAGLVAVSRRFTDQWVSEEIFFFVLGTVVLATGLLHMFGEQRIGGFRRDRLTRIQFLLGVFEVLIGALLLLSPNMDQPFVYWAATAWALIYGIFAFLLAVRSYRANKQEKNGSPEGEPQEEA